MRTLVIADSRGAGLQTILKSKENIGDTEVLVYRGAGSELAAIRAIPTVKRFKPDLIILHAGICDLTWRDRNTKRTYLRHRNTDENIKHLMMAYGTALDLLNALENTQISVATLTGLDLSDYNNADRKNMDSDEYRIYEKSAKIVDPSQCTLDDTIVGVNRQITELNKKHGIPTTWLAGVVHTYYRKRVHHYYRRLWDGCHPDKTTNNAWAGQVEKTIRRVVASNTKHQTD